MRKTHHNQYCHLRPSLFILWFSESASRAVPVDFKRSDCLLFSTFASFGVFSGANEDRCSSQRSADDRLSGWVELWLCYFEIASAVQH